jgi:hypothetical protein
LNHFLQLFDIHFQLENSPYGEVRASHLTAVAAKDNVSSIVEVSVYAYTCL